MIVSSYDDYQSLYTEINQERRTPLLNIQRCEISCGVYVRLSLFKTTRDFFKAIFILLRCVVAEFRSLHSVLRQLKIIIYSLRTRSEVQECQLHEKRNSDRRLVQPRFKNCVYEKEENETLIQNWCKSKQWADELDIDGYFESLAS